MSVAREDPHYVAIPVFLSRAFRHSSVYIRTDKGIAGPQDLRGRRIGVAEYQLTANVWIRGILQSEHGVHPRDILWVRGGMDTPGRPEKIALKLPDDVRMEQAPDGATLDGMLRSGEIDGFIGPRAPRCFQEGHPLVDRLFADTGAAEAYFRRTGIFPIMHVLGLRRSLAQEHRWLPGALLKAFEQARQLAVEALADTSAAKVTMPFVEDSLSHMRRLMGPDPWSYGLAGNRTTLETFLDHHFDQGLSPRRVAIDELFDPASWKPSACDAATDDQSRRPVRAGKRRQPDPRPADPSPSGVFGRRARPASQRPRRTGCAGAAGCS